MSVMGFAAQVGGKTTGVLERDIVVQDAGMRADEKSLVRKHAQTRLHSDFCRRLYALLADGRPYQIALEGPVEEVLGWAEDADGCPSLDRYRVSLRALVLLVRLCDAAVGEMVIATAADVCNYATRWSIAVPGTIVMTAGMYGGEATFEVGDVAWQGGRVKVWVRTK